MKRILLLLLVLFTAHYAVGQVCDATAGEALPDAPTQVCMADAGAFNLANVFAPTTGGFDDGAGNFDAANTNYVAVNQATGEIISVATSDAMIDLSGAPVGTTACVYQLAYTQALFDDVTMFVDDQLCSVLCIPVVGPCLGDAVGFCPGVTPVELAPFLDAINGFFGFNETQICNFLDNQILTIPDPTGLFGDIDIDLAGVGLDFCADKSNAPYCVQIIDCMSMCEATAPVVSNDGGDCDADPDGSGDNTPFVFSEDGTGNTTAPFFTEYIVTDGAGGTIIGVFATLADAQTAANAEAVANGDACIQAINHEGLEAIVNDLDTQTNGLLCTSGIVTCPVNDLATLYGALAGAGAALTVADVVALVGPPDTGVIGFDLGALIGFPPGILVVDIPPFCYQLGNEDCVTVAPCAVSVCQGLSAPPAVASPVNLCDGDGPIDVCFDMIDPAEGLNFDVSIDGAPFGVIAGTATGAANQLCIQLPAVANTGCDVTTFNITFNSITCDNGENVPGPSGGDLATDLGTFVINVYPQLSVVTTGNGACADLTAELQAADATACDVVAVVTCAADGDVLAYDFSGYAYGDGVLASATACPPANTMGTLTCGGCTSDLDISIADPCNCNFGIDFEGDGINNLAQETITISGGDGNYMITNVSVPGLVDNTNTVLAAGPVGSTLVAFLPADGVTTYTIEVTDGAGNVATLTGGPCDVCPEAPEQVPTVGEWGLIILALMMSITAVIGIRQKREEEVYG